jgi:apolipoprotein N-acyltransferase
MNNRVIRNIAFLLIGSVFLYFSNGRYSFALAAWLFPVFFLQVSRKEKGIYSSVFIPLLTAVACQLSFWKFTNDNPSNILFFLPFILGLPMGLLFYLDRKLYSNSKNFSATLIFPVIYTSFDFLLNLFNPFGTLGILGYSQYDFLSFSQLASVTGMWGLTFMITWFGALLFWVGENYSDKKKVVKGASIYFAILLSILFYGSIRLNYPLPDGTVRVAGIHTHDKRIEGEQMNSFLEKGDTAGFKSISDTIVHRLIRETIRQSEAGARIVVWSEISAKILQSAEAGYIEKFKQLAREQDIVLIATPFVVSQDEKKSENKVLMFSPAGELVLIHYKYGGNFMEGTKEGNRVISAVATDYGKLSAIICWDGDFPSVVKQVGQLQTDILFEPASDWEQIDPAHSIVTAFRGIENGCSVVRQTRNGLSLMTDPRGKIIAQMDHFNNTSWVTVGQVPNKRWFTLYPVIGDLVGWFSLLGLLYVVYMALRKKKSG